MPVKKSKKRKVHKPRYTVPSYCPICKRGDAVDWKNTLLLNQFLTRRGKIMPRSRSGVCASHQRQLSREIKRARIATLLPFVRG